MNDSDKNIQQESDNPRKSYTDKCKEFRKNKLVEFENVLDDIGYNKPQTPQEKYLQYHKDLWRSCRELSRLKQLDYCDLSDETDDMAVFGNFMLPEQMGIITTEQALLSRIADKFNRLITVINNGECNVGDETELDTIKDITNFMILLSYYREIKDGK